MCGKRKKVVHAASISSIFSLSSKQKKTQKRKRGYVSKNSKNIERISIENGGSVLDGGGKGSCDVWSRAQECENASKWRNVFDLGKRRKKNFVVQVSTDVLE